MPPLPFCAAASCAPVPAIATAPTPAAAPRARKLRRLTSALPDARVVLLIPGPPECRFWLSCLMTMTLVSAFRNCESRRCRRLQGVGDVEGIGDLRNTCGGRGDDVLAVRAGRS